MKAILLVCASVMVVASFGRANAQTAPVASPTPQTDVPDPAIEEGDIVVTGIRQSIARAAEIKRDASQVLDVITSEDVGKLPDANALQRVTGVQITRVFGEGQAVNSYALSERRFSIGLRAKF